jgi:hypothetical protein
MSVIDYPVLTRAGYLRLGSLIGLGLVVVAVICLPQFSASRECRGGAFSSGFSSGFAVKRCKVVVRRFDTDLFSFPWPAS